GTRRRSCRTRGCSRSSCPAAGPRSPVRRRRRSRACTCRSLRARCVSEAKRRLAFPAPAAVLPGGRALHSFLGIPVPTMAATPKLLLVGDFPPPHGGVAVHVETVQRAVRSRG